MEAKKQVLLVEDVPSHSILTIKFLNHCGISNDLVTTGQECLSYCRDKRPDLILLDIGLPDMSGIEVLQQLRTQPSYANLPIIAETAHAVYGKKEELLSLGFTDCLEKPFSIEQFTTVVRKHLPIPENKKEAD